MSEERAGKPTAPPKSGKLATEVKARRIYWDWADRIPRRELTIIEGSSGVAKSTVAGDIGARITVGGKSLPDDPYTRRSGWFVTLSAEDDAGAVVKPRLVAAGADLSRCPILYATGDKLLVDGEEIHELQLPDDVDQVEDWLRWIRVRDAVGPAVVLVDPLVAFIDTKVNTDRDHPTRRAMRPLLRLAKRYDASFLIIRHWVKDLRGRTAATAGGGSGALFNASRAALAVAIHPDDRDVLGDPVEKDPRRRIIAGGKSNYGGLARSLEFRLRTTRIHVDDLDLITARVEWLGNSEVTADELVRADDLTRGGTRQPTKLDVAKGLLDGFLAFGAVSWDGVLTLAAQNHISEATARRARAELGLKHRVLGRGRGEAQRSYWARSEVDLDVMEAKLHRLWADELDGPDEQVK